MFYNMFYNYFLCCITYCLNLFADHLTVLVFYSTLPLDFTVSTLQTSADGGRGHKLTTYESVNPQNTSEIPFVYV